MLVDANTCHKNDNDFISIAALSSNLAFKKTCTIKVHFCPNFELSSGVRFYHYAYR